MGCCGERAYRDNEQAESIIIKYESELPLTNIKASELVASCQKYIKSKKIHETFLSKILNNMKTNKNSDTSNLITHFYINEAYSYNSQQLITFMILLAEGKKDEKVKLIFINYLEESQKVITKENINIMVKHICEISLLILPRFASAKEPENMILSRYRNDVSSDLEFVISYYTQIIFDNLTGNITCDSLMRAFSFKELSDLLYPSYLRQRAFKLIKLVLRAQSTVDTLMSKEFFDRGNESERGRSRSVSEKV